MIFLVMGYDSSLSDPWNISYLMSSLLLKKPQAVVDPESFLFTAERKQLLQPSKDEMFLFDSIWWPQYKLFGQIGCEWEDVNKGGWNT